MDSYGTMFVSDNDDDGNDQTRICYVMPGGNYGYHPRGKGQTHWHEEQPGVVPMLLRTYRGSPTGMCFYEGTLLPEKYRGQPLHVDAGPGRLSCYHMTVKGAAYTLGREDMVTSKDTWFRPSDVCVAPDGSVYICDWYDPGVGGHGIRDFDRGRVYRIVVLVDEKGDGKATKAVTFYQGPEIYGPLGVCVAPYPDGKGQRVFVCQSPDILVFEDKDGDLKADGPPKKLLTGFGGFDHDHGVHGLNIGPDGKLYFTVGDAGAGEEPAARQAAGGLARGIVHDARPSVGEGEVPAAILSGRGDVSKSITGR